MRDLRDYTTRMSRVCRDCRDLLNRLNRVCRDCRDLMNRMNRVWRDGRDSRTRKNRWFLRVTTVPLWKVKPYRNARRSVGISFSNFFADSYFVNHILKNAIQHKGDALITLCDYCIPFRSSAIYHTFKKAVLPQSSGKNP